MQPLYSNKTPKAKPRFDTSPSFLANPFSKLPTSPMFSRKSSVSKKEKLFQSGKSSEQKSIEKSLKYTKFIPYSPKNQVTQVHSEVHIIDLRNSIMEKSSDTAYQPRSRSKKNSDIFFMTKKRSKDKSQGKNILEMSARDGNKKGKGVKVEDHYVYWKNKAHQYLELNIKLMNDVRRLTKENEQLKVTVTEKEESLKSRKNDENLQVYSEKMLSREIRNISAIYMAKIESMEKQLKRKEIIIASYELRMQEMGNKLAGDNDRIKLISRLQQQLDRLKQQLSCKRKLQPLSFQFSQSTSNLTHESSIRRVY